MRRARAGARARILRARNIKGLSMNAPSPNIQVLTVSQLTHAIKMRLEPAFPSIWLQGEASNCKLQSSGHLYFTLKDAQAQISAVMFRGDLASVKTPIKDGSQLILRGELNVYPPSGKYQIIVRELRLAGLGELLLRLEELKAKLSKKGWFDPQHKKPLPKFPKRIGVVTSPTGAVIQDILHILNRRFAGVHLILNPVKVQGEGAAQEIAQAIAQFNRYQLADVLIVGRGGGSIEDLWAFNEEIVAEAIFNSQIPIISAVGHETDYCIADFVADVRAPTPSAAAEIVIAEKSQQLKHLDQTQRRLQHTISHLIRHHKQRLKAICQQPWFGSPYVLLGPWMQRLDGYRHQLDETMQSRFRHQRVVLEGCSKRVQTLRPSTQIMHFRHKLVHLERALSSTLAMRFSTARKLLRQKEDRLRHAWQTSFASKKRLFDPAFKQKQLDQSWNRCIALYKERFRKVQDGLQAIDPKSLLKKGFCILFSDEDNHVISSVKMLEPQQNVRILLGDGEANAKITEVKDIL